MEVARGRGVPPACTLDALRFSEDRVPCGRWCGLEDDGGCGGGGGC